MPPKNLTRREVLRAAALAALVLPLGSASYAAAPAVVKKSPRTLRLGVAGYTTRMLTLDESIATLKILRLTNASVFKTHCNWETASLDECRAVGEKLKAAGLTLAGSGVINLTTDEAKCRQAFENVRAAGMATMICKPDRAALPLVERLAKEYDQRLAIHNHGPEDTFWPSPLDVWKAIQPLDARIGMCLDVGHTARAGVDPVAAIRTCAPRLYDLHLKDSVAVPGAMKDIPVEVGAGRLDIRGILAALLEIDYAGVVAFEYEKVAANPVTGLAESVGYVRGMLAAMA